VAALFFALDARADGFLDQADCDSIRGWAATPGDKDTPLEVKLTFDGAASDAGTVQHPVLADLHRDDLCGMFGCEHGYETTVPLSLLDGFEHTVHVYESDGADGVGAELQQSPKTFTCDLALPSGVKRKVSNDATMSAWHFSPFWDEISVSDGIASAYPDGARLPEAPEVVHTAAMPDALFVLDVTKNGAKVSRAVGDASTAVAWEFFAAQAATVDDASLAGTPAAQPLRSRPFVLRAPDGTLYLVDDDPETGSSPSGSGGNGGGANGDTPLSKGSCSCRLAGAESAPVAWWAAISLGLGTLVHRRRK
jgi:MYXO-CTERM domain-containing protein